MTHLVHRWRRLSAVLSLVGSMLALPALAQQHVADFSAGPPSGRYSFDSRTPQTLTQLLDPAAPGEPAQPDAYLYLPDAPKEAPRLPAVVLLHGSGGLYSALLDHWPKRLNEAGYAALVIDIFGPRGVKSTAEDQSQVPFAADVADAFAALKLLATHPRIDPQRIAIMGFSRGGVATWRTGVQRLIQAQGLPGGLHFAAHIPVYSGGCAGAMRLRVQPGVFAPEPMLWIHGDADDYAAIGPCQDYAERIRAVGTPVEFVVLPGARHKFDSDDTRLHQVRGAQRTLESCPLEYDMAANAWFDRFTGQRLSRESFRSVQQSCGAIGASVEGDRAARDKATAAVLDFLGRVLR